MDEAFRKRIERDMTGLMRDHVGGGFVPEFYRDEAGPFAAACESFVEEAVRAEGERIAREVEANACTVCRKAGRGKRGSQHECCRYWYAAARIARGQS